MGSILEALENGVFEWDDHTFFAYLNEAIIGTPIPRASLSDAMKIAGSSFPKRSVKDQAEAIRKTLKNDPSFLTFLDAQSQKLPRTISVFIYTLQPITENCLSKVVPKYKDALDRLG